MLDLQSFKGFTPGKWNCVAENLRGGKHWSVYSETDSICMSDGIHEADNGEANAALIAAAPDLLALAIKQADRIAKLEARLRRDRIELQAVVDILDANDPYTLEYTARWDDADCDAACLYEEAKNSVEEIDAILAEPYHA